MNKKYPEKILVGVLTGIYSILVDPEKTEVQRIERVKLLVKNSLDHMGYVIEQGDGNDTRATKGSE